MTAQRTFAALLALCLLTMTACTGTNPGFGGSEEDLQPGYEEMVEGNYVEPDPPDPPVGYTEQVARWSCTLSVTYNDDWHDDVLCIKGNEVERPYLRGWDDYVEESEILDSASEYEAHLNAGG